MSGTEGREGPAFDFGRMAAQATAEMAENARRMSDVAALFAQAVAATPPDKRAAFAVAGLMLQADFLLRAVPPGQREGAARFLLGRLASLAEGTLPDNDVMKPQRGDDDA